MKYKNFILIITSLILGILLCEIALRVKNHFILDYDIEMWRYAKLLKKADANPKINHTHIKNKSAILQGVKIRINNHGQRDKNYSNKELKNYKKSFLFVGSSVTLGWGVEAEKTFINLLNIKAKEENKDWIFVNGGVGNYNAQRYISNYFEHWENLEFTDLVVNFFVNDTEIIKKKDTNFFLKNTHLGVTIWKLFNSFKSYQANEKLDEYYKLKYDENYEGFQVAKKELLKLFKYCKSKKINCSIFLFPDIHKSNPYPLDFIDKKISIFAKINNINYLDVYKAIAEIDNKKLWNKYKDPHPNEYAHSLFAELIYDYLKK